MKNKFAIIAFLSTVITASFAFAVEEGSAENQAQNLATHKTQIISELNKQKSVIDSSISCINGAQNRDAIKKCNDQRKASMDALRAERVEIVKGNLQKRSDKINEKIQKIDQRTAEKAAQTK